MKLKLFKRKTKDTSAQEHSFIGYIIKNNRQIIEKEVIASKRFRIEDGIYFIKPECIFLKNVNGTIKSVAVYKEGNPNPYDFVTTENNGITPKDLDKIFAEDFFNIIVDINPANKTIYILVLVIINFAINLVFCIGGGIHLFF